MKEEELNRHDSYVSYSEGHECVTVSSLKSSINWIPDRRPQAVINKQNKNKSPSFFISGKCALLGCKSLEKKE